MKAMMVFIRETCKHLTDEIRNQSISGNEFELKDVFGKFSMDTLASCAFGVDAQSFSSLGKFAPLAVQIDPLVAPKHRCTVVGNPGGVLGFFGKFF